MTERFETVIVGGGQAGLATGYHLARRGRSFAILDAGERVGDSWRSRWPSLRLYSPARFDSLPGLEFPAPRHSFPRVGIRRLRSRPTTRAPRTRAHRGSARS